jgi:hypothetical protein
MMAHLVMTPSTRKPWLFSATLDGVVIVKASRQPLLDGARALLGLGWSPTARLTASHAGDTTAQLQSTIGEAAKWTVTESDRGGLRKALWQPYEVKR